MKSEKLVACDSHWHSLWNNISQARSRTFNSEAESNSWYVSGVSCTLEASLWIKSCKNNTGRIKIRPSHVHTIYRRQLRVRACAFFLLKMNSPKLLSWQTWHDDRFNIIFGKQFCLWVLVDFSVFNEGTVPFRSHWLNSTVVDRCLVAGEGPNH